MFQCVSTYIVSTCFLYSYTVTFCNRFHHIPSADMLQGNDRAFMSMKEERSWRKSMELLLKMPPSGFTCLLLFTLHQSCDFVAMFAFAFASCFCFCFHASNEVSPALIAVFELTNEVNLWLESLMSWRRGTQSEYFEGQPGQPGQRGQRTSSKRSRPAQDKTSFYAHPSDILRCVLRGICFLLLRPSGAVERMAPRLLWIWQRGRILDEF